MLLAEELDEGEWVLNGKDYSGYSMWGSPLQRLLSDGYLDGAAR